MTLEILEILGKHCMELIDNLFDSNQVNYINETILPYFERKLKVENFNALSPSFLKNAVGM